MTCGIGDPKGCTFPNCASSCQAHCQGPRPADGEPRVLCAPQGLTLQALALHRATAKLGYVITALFAGLVAEGFCMPDAVKTGAAVLAEKSLKLFSLADLPTTRPSITQDKVQQLTRKRPWPLVNQHWNYRPRRLAADDKSCTALRPRHEFLPVEPPSATRCCYVVPHPSDSSRRPSRAPTHSARCFSAQAKQRTARAPSKRRRAPVWGRALAPKTFRTRSRSRTSCWEPTNVMRRLKKSSRRRCGFWPSRHRELPFSRIANDGTRSVVVPPKELVICDGTPSSSHIPSSGASVRPHLAIAGDIDGQRRMW